MEADDTNEAASLTARFEAIRQRLKAATAAEREVLARESRSLSFDMHNRIVALYLTEHHRKLREHKIDR